MTRRILPILSLLLALSVLSACGDAGLNVRGTVSVSSEDATRRFDFSNETRLDGSSAGRFTGTCTLRRVLDAEGATQWATVVEIHSGGTTGDELPLTSIAIVQNSGAAPAAGRVEVELGGSIYQPVAGACAVEVPYALQDGVLGLTAECDVADAGGASAHVSLDLDLAGCHVEG